MKKIFYLIIIALFFITKHYGQESTFSLTIKVKNLRSNDGLVGIDFFDENQAKIKGEYIPIKNNVAIITYDKLNKGKYGVRVYHDENKNDKMDFNWLKLPKEGFGYTGEQQLKPPKTEDMLFLLDKDKTVEIGMMYIL